DLRPKNRTQEKETTQQKGNRGHQAPTEGAKAETH
ncbi:hypothetical protein AVEN_256157-1, partial [Araneus ventricosus]